MKKCWFGNAALCGIALYLAIAPGIAKADCSLITQLRVAARQQFRTISGEKLNRFDDDVKSTIVADGAKCKISRSDDGKFATHSCEWLIGKDVVETKNIFRQMVAETTPCLISKVSSPIRSGDRSETVTFEDVPNSWLTIQYDFESGWYLLGLEYGIETK